MTEASTYEAFVTKRSKGFQWKLEKVVTKENDRSNSYYTTEKRVIATVGLKALLDDRKLRAFSTAPRTSARGPAASVAVGQLSSQKGW
jgi:hypothetical protein